jgi:hypothetical protein
LWAAPNPARVVLKVTGKDRQLLMQEKPGELFPKSELSFFAKKSDDVVTLELDNEGRVSRLVIHTGGRVIPLGDLPIAYRTPRNDTRTVIGPEPSLSVSQVGRPHI